jgi:hypothetical protein
MSGICAGAPIAIVGAPEAAHAPGFDEAVAGFALLRKDTGINPRKFEKNPPSLGDRI